MNRAAIGVKAKTGRGIAVVLADSGKTPEFVCREELRFYDDDVPDTIQPYHQVMELPWSDWTSAVRPKIAAIDEIAAATLGTFVEALQARRLRIACIAVVGPADRKLERIGNPHIRAHAAEGVLYRAVVERAAKSIGLVTRSFVDPAEALDRPAREIKKVLADLGKAAGAPWRADEKAAAIAAWAALTPRRSSSR